jgi:CHAT domain-containing protein
MVVLCSGTVACHVREDTEPRAKWPRTAEARVTGAEYAPCTQKAPVPGRIVPEMTCAPPQDSGKACDGIDDRAAAVRRVVHERRCISAAIEALERFTKTDPRAWNDLAAAYLIRARYEDRASDLLDALEAAEHAVAVQPVASEARFNLALAQEAVGLDAQALASWGEAAKEPGGWSDDARMHLQRLQRLVVRDPVREWQRVAAQLPWELDARNEATVARLIEPFPRNALEYFEANLLSRPDDPATVLYARVLSKRLKIDPSRLADALQLDAEVRVGQSLAITGQTTEAVSLVTRAEEKARQGGYRYIAARARAIRGYAFFRESDYGRSTLDNDAAIAMYREFGDGQSIASLYRTNSGNYREQGDGERAWIESLKALPYLADAADRRIHSVVYGEAASAALTLDNRAAALELQNAGIQRLQAELRVNAPAAGDIQKLLSSAYRERARIEIARNDAANAGRDLADALRNAPPPTGDTRQNYLALQALVKELQAHLASSVNVASAVTMYTDAINAIPPDELRTMRASLFAQRADANRRLDRVVETERDLKSALRELEAEQNALLSARTRSDDKTHDWIRYFARFNDVYQQLIDVLVQGKRYGEAFAYAERAHAAEPLDLLRKLDDAPPEFRRLVAQGPMQLAQIQQQLGPGVYLLQYSVAPAHTYVWVLSRTALGMRKLPVGASQIKVWADALRDARNDERAFSKGLAAPYEALISSPLAAVRAMNGGAPPARLVLVPDGDMHGLPFSALRDAKEQRYLMQVAPIEISPSATLYAFAVMRDRALAAAGAASSALLVADPRLDPEHVRTYGIQQLRYAREEVEQIRPFYAPHVDVLTGNEATTAAVLRLAQNRSVVHIAAHSIVNPHDPARSLLFLTSTPEYSGALEAQELLSQLKLGQTRLVVLAACSSAGGLPVGSEGVAPLVRPMIAAGVPGVIGTLWDVNDATAVRLSVSFHRHYGLEGRDAATALQLAQQDLLGDRSAMYSSVLTWAPFQVIGHASSPSVSTQKVEQGAHSAIHRKDSLQRDDGIHPQ